jgi:hypothetical protein
MVEWLPSKKIYGDALMVMLGSLNAKALKMHRFKIKAVVMQWLQHRLPKEFFV